MLDQARADNELTLVAVRYACGVDAAAVEADQWWGSRDTPLAFTMSPGDCLLLDGTYYCLEAVAHERSGTFRPRYKPVGANLLEALPGDPG